MASAYLQALLLTGARREEMAGLRWEDVDFQWRSLTIRDKVEGTRVIPLTPYLASLITALPHLSIHGLRRSFGTLCEWVEVPSGISAQIIGHKPSALAVKHYRRRPLDLLRKWHDQIEAWVLEQAGVSFVPVESGLYAVK